MNTPHFTQTVATFGDGALTSDNLVITRSAAAAEQARQTETNDGDSDMIGQADKTDTQTGQASSELTTINELNQTLRDFGQIDINDIDQGSDEGVNPDVANEFQRAQRQDPSLTNLWERARAVSRYNNVLWLSITAWSRIFHPCSLVPIIPVSHFQSPQIQPNHSGPKRD